MYNVVYRGIVMNSGYVTRCAALERVYWYRGSYGYDCQIVTDAELPEYLRFYGKVA